ncbi:hypothetical protein CFR78_04965 [Komagataeibacter rhaeticus]|uniref:hypothetical protein n=1 Tax=Komagataeibacter rhaeticus TaxID=215221 RepID=UPI000207FE6F|nr:hypothetical protein [Komagataeibacter rhaeticus]EGG77073.1 hypothetical protein SXCC_02284 [Gluconacetobacter sp. SXCC-1]KDU96110.1 hypothetical protein GLUCORHAEAF1_04230 [Komagataeibacter rhaeticus AF1]PYD54308.1 hypothetical protein CFR78_04965 [Komagataeibacter rhaeticus]SAY48352.1 hypothetical protein KRIGEM_01299 [Komagataeibacter rhaeticus]
MAYRSDGTDRSSRPAGEDRDLPLATSQQKKHVLIVGCMVVFFATLIVTACLYFPHIPLPRF